jgi:hypothetical protein
VPDLGHLLSQVLLAVTVALGGGTPPADPPPEPARERSATTAAAVATLPRGGTMIFPRHRVVALYGGATTHVLGVLGEGTPRQAAQRLLRVAKRFHTRRRPVLPAFELIATVAQAAPGADGMYRAPTRPADIQRYLVAARRAKAILILDIQPGRADFLREVRRYERFLRQPDVSVALDPEWSMRPGEVPGRTIGWTDAATINRVSAYLDGLVKRHRLPQKLLVVHQFTGHMVRNRQAVKHRRGLAITFHIDGFGTRAAKRAKYRELHARPPHRTGFKLFYDEDVDLLQPREVLQLLRPAPDLVTYQ